MIYRENLSWRRSISRRFFTVGGGWNDFGPAVLILFITAILFCGQSICHASGQWHRVSFVYDGDTVLLDSRERVRYLGINSPEIDHEGKKSEFMALDAGEFNRNLVMDHLVRLEFDVKKRDRYGRLLAFVFLRNGEMVNALMVRKGLAYVLTIRPNMKYRNLLVERQREALKEGVGIWSRPFGPARGGLPGNTKSFRFHRPDCPFGRRISRKKLIRFRSARQAFMEGFSPCKRCNPARR